MLSLPAYVLLTAGASLLLDVVILHVLPFLLLRACFPLLLMYLICSWRFIRLF
jgi:hypothetical protein